MQVCDDINVGDLVYLKSGSPKMTVVSIDEQNSKCRCMWIRYGGGKLHDEFLPTSALKKAW